jgi:hypothetical protein
MAMHAGLVAAIANIDLQSIEPPAPQRRKRNPFEQGPRFAHRAGVGERP